jgi:hypothetical protein
MRKLSKICLLALIGIANGQYASADLPLPNGEPMMITEGRLINEGTIVLGHNSNSQILGNLINSGQIIIHKGANIVGTENIINENGGVTIHQQDEQINDLTIENTISPNPE